MWKSKLLMGGILGIPLSMLQGCYALQRATVPMGQITYRTEGSEQERKQNLLVLLPGIGDSRDAYEKRGFIDYLRESDFGRGFPFDVVAVNAHFKYYSNRSIVTRLREDVVEPALSAGYENIHFVGISLGGFGSLLYLRDHPDDVSTVTLLAPYVGDPEHFAYLENESLDPPHGLENRSIWPWLEKLPERELRKIYLGFGEDDKFARGNALLGRRYLDPTRVVTVEGGHDWSVWERLWPELLLRVKRDVVGEGLLANGSMHSGASRSGG